MKTTARVALSFVVAAAGAGMGAGVAQADQFSFEAPQYVPASPLTGITDPNGSTWQMEGTQLADWVVDGAVHSPLAGGAKSLRFDFVADDDAHNARVGLDLATPITSGIVTIQYDFLNNTRISGNNLFRLQVMNRAGITPSNPAVATDVLYQPYMQNGGGAAAAQNGFFGRNGAGNPGLGVFTDNYAQPFSPVLATEGQWRRLKMWFNLNDTTYPGRLIYAAMYDINCGSEILIGQRHIAAEAGVSLTPWGGTTLIQVRSFQLRATGGDANSPGVDQSFWIDNLVIAQDNGFVLPPPINGQPTPPPPMRQARAQEVVPEFAIDNPGFGAGNLPSLALAGTTLFTLDGDNGLTSWNTVTRPSNSTHVDDASELVFSTIFGDEAATGVMAADPNGQLLYVLADNFTDLFFGDFWRDLNTYPIGSVDAGFTLLASGGELGGGTGNHSVSLLRWNGVTHLVNAYLGAEFYTSINTDVTLDAQLLRNVGNRWAGATTEVLPEGQLGSSMYYLQQTDANGNPISSLTMQAYNAIYRADFGLGCDASSALLSRVSRSQQILPWVTRAADGPGVNRHAMEYVPATGRIWVVRAGDTNDIGIYDLAADTWGILNLRRNGADLPIERADLQLVGNRMFFIIHGDNTVYSVDAIGEGTPVVPPPNDNCANATPVGEGVYPFTNQDATTDGPVEAALCTSGDNGEILNDVWFRYTPGRTCLVTVSLCAGTAFDTKLAAYNASGGCPTSPGAIACNDDACSGGGPSVIQFSVSAGTQYLLRIGGWGGAAGSGMMTISRAVATCPCDWNNSGTINSQDFFDFLTAFFAGNADYNHDGLTNSQDFFDFLTCFFSPPSCC